MVIKKLATNFLFLLLFISAQAQSMYLGKKTEFPASKSAPIYRTMDIMMQMGAPKFHMRVGGVAFSDTAAPVLSLNIDDITLKYDVNEKDGSRFKVTIRNGQESLLIKQPIYDWQLIPIARFANEKENNSVVSMFGKSQNPNKDQIVYSSAMLDHLLGLRMLQADLFVQIEDGMLSLFKDESMKLVYGKGETTVNGKLGEDIVGSIIDTLSDTLFVYDYETFLSEKYVLTEPENLVVYNGYLEFEKINDLIVNYGEEVNSWVFSDYDEEVTFTVQDNEIKFITSEVSEIIYNNTTSAFDTITYRRGVPYYTFTAKNWDSYTDSVMGIINVIDRNKVDVDVRQLFDRIYELKADTAMDAFMELLYFGREITAGEYIHAALYNYTDSLIASDQTEDKSKVAFKLIRNELPVRLFEMTPDIVFEKELTTRLRQYDLLKLNPNVYSAAQNMMNYSAFFRYVKYRFPIAWTAFISSIQNVKIDEPKVFTPAQMGL